MTEKTYEDQIIDERCAEIAAENMPDSAVEAATQRVWGRISTEIAAQDKPLSSCEDYRELIPQLIDDTLPTARKLLVKDHMSECVPCRRALMDARAGQTSDPDTPRSERKQSRPFLRIAAAAVIVLGTAALSFHLLSNLVINRSLQAAVQEVDGGLHVIQKDTTRFLFAGAEVRADQDLRTSKNSGASIELEDGSTIEMDERSEISLNKSRQGTKINLKRGNIIVHAADQKDGKLYVTTDDCEVAVKGTVFSVAHGIKGSRVSVIEGEVEVSQGSDSQSLLPGDQSTTSARLGTVPIEQEIAWSKNAEQHLALLREFTALHKDMAKAADVIDARTSTRLLELSPADTLVYAGIPNMTEGMVRARAVFDERVASSPVLGDWWQSKVVENGIETEIEDMLNRLESLGGAVGDEISIAVPRSAINDGRGVLILAELDDPDGFVDMLNQEIERLNAEAGEELPLVLLDNLDVAPTSGEHLYLWVTNDLFAAAMGLDSLRQLEQRIADGTTFSGTELYQRLAATYASGVEWIFGIDLREVFDAAAAENTDPDGMAALEELGLLDARTLILKRTSDQGLAQTSASLKFDGPRHGMAGWLAEPAPMGTIDFVSPNAFIAGAVVAKDASDMFDDLLSTLAVVKPEAINQLREFEASHGFDLKADLAATLGGEAAFALDGPVLPVPSWKLIVEVYDPGTLNHSVSRAIDEVNQILEQENQEIRIATAVTRLAGRDFVTIGVAGAAPVVAYTIIDGFLVAGPTAALVNQAIEYRSTGLTLPNSAVFKDLLPVNGYTDCSGLSFRNLGALTSILPESLLGSLPAEAEDVLQQSSAPSLFCVYGEPDEIILEGNGGSFIGLTPLMGLSSIMNDLGELEDAAAGFEVSS